MKYGERALHMVPLVLIGVLALALAGCYGTLEGAATFHGETLSNRITGNRIRAAVLPTVDWSHLDTKKEARPEAFDSIQVMVTNEIARTLWQKNRLRVVGRDALIPNMQASGLTMQDVFPQPTMSSKYLTPLSRIEAIGQGEPDYEKLSRVGRSMEADLLFLSRVTRNCRDGSNNDIIIDLLVLDVASKQPIAWGYYGARVPTDKDDGLTNAAHTMLYYAPMPDSAFLADQRSSQSTAAIGSFLLQNVGGINLDIGRSMDFADETWRMYPSDYFEQNYVITTSDYQRMYPR